MIAAPFATRTTDTPAHTQSSTPAEPLADVLAQIGPPPNRPPNHPLAHLTKQQLLDLTNAVLDDWADSAMTELGLCRAHNLTLEQLEALAATPRFQACLASIERLRAARAEPIANALADQAREALARITARAPTTASQSKETRLAAKLLMPPPNPTHVRKHADSPPPPQAHPPARPSRGLQPARSPQPTNHPTPTPPTHQGTPPQIQARTTTQPPGPITQRMHVRSPSCPQETTCRFTQPLQSRPAPVRSSP